MDDMSNKLNGIQLEMTGEYAKFIEKFKPKKTTDDCYTPPNIYETVKTWALVAEKDKNSGDTAETYTTGYRYGHRNGQIELLQQILGIFDGTSEPEETNE